ncbi:MAG: hypothetical protein QOI00_2271, partial [Chloroflexota bacterium]|nr:hypothetical protein [Chloroflexota bacterium]
GSGTGSTDGTGANGGGTAGGTTDGTGANGGGTTDGPGAGGSGAGSSGGTGGSSGGTTDGTASGTGAGAGIGGGSDPSSIGDGSTAGGAGSNGGAGGVAGVDTTTGGTPGGTTGAPDGTTGGGHGVTAGPGWGALASALQTLGIDRPPSITILPMLVGTTTAMTMAFAFAIFGKKRRDEEPPAPDEVLRANAARGQSVVPTSDVLNGVVRATTIPGPIDIEAGMPRWRRPSLLEARKADPARTVVANHRMSFDTALGTDGRERRTIRYAVVRLLDAPDELRSAEIGQLDQGDEVQLIERSGSYWLVLCPDGRQGWLHKMTLGDVVSDAPAYVREVDDDVLSAFLTARARTA